MVRRTLVTAGLIAFFAAVPAVAQDAPDVDIHVANLTLGPDGVRIGEAVNATDRPGYDNQPWFTPDGSGFWYALEEAGQTDIFRYDLSTGTSTRVTDTSWGEYSPSPIEGSDGILAVGGPPEFGLWSYTASGEQDAPLFEPGLPVGYYGIFDSERLFAWLNDGDGTLIWVDRRTGTITPFRDRASPGPIRRIPGEETMSFVEPEMDGQLWVKRLDPRSLEVTRITPVAGDGWDFIWTPDGRILMGDGNAIFAWSPESPDGWAEVARFPDLGDITRLAVSPDGTRIAFVAPVR